MTSRQRISAALNHLQPDRTPIFEYVLLSPLADLFLKRSYAGDPANWAGLVKELGWEAAVRQNAADRVELAEMLGHDMLYVTPNPPPDETLEEPAPSGADPVENLQRRNDAEARRPPAEDDSFLIYRLVLEELERRGLDLPVLAPAYFHGVWTDTDLMQNMLLEPEAAHRHFQLATRKALACIQRYAALGIDQVGVGGDFSGNRPVISPMAYRSFIVPEVRKVTDCLHAAGSYAINASDGNLWPFIDDFLFGCGADGYLEIDLHAGMDLGRLKRAYGERVTFYGNLDCGIELSFGTPEIVRQHTLDCLQQGSGSGGHILCASNAITASIPLANYLAAVGAYREYFSLPALKLDL